MERGFGNSANAQLATAADGAAIVNERGNANVSAAVVTVSEQSQTDLGAKTLVSNRCHFETCKRKNIHR